MTFSIIELQEIERRAYAAGDTEKSNLAAQLCAALSALEKLTEAADDLASHIEKEAKSPPAGIADGYALLDTESDKFTDFVNAVTDAQEITE